VGFSWVSQFIQLSVISFCAPLSSAMPTSRETWDEIRSEYHADAKTSENSMMCNAPQNESKPRLRVLAYIRLLPQIRITNRNDTK
jgi:hypothetical protein